jgi:hypothetical protein
MADPYLADWCPQRQMPLIVIARHEGWLEQLGDPEADSLWAEFNQVDAQQAAIVRSITPGVTAPSAMPSMPPAPGRVGSIRNPPCQSDWKP